MWGGAPRRTPWSDWILGLSPQDSRHGEGRHRDGASNDGFSGDHNNNSNSNSNNNDMMRNLVPPEPTLLLHCRLRRWDDVGHRLKTHPEEATLMPLSVTSSSSSSSSSSTSAQSMRYGVTPSALSVAASSRAPLETIRLLVNASRAPTNRSTAAASPPSKPLLAVTHHRYGTVLHDALRTGASPDVVQFLIESMMEYEDEKPRKVAFASPPSSREITPGNNTAAATTNNRSEDDDDDDDDNNQMLFHEYFGHVPTSDGRRSTNLRSSQILMEPLALEAFMTDSNSKTTTAVAPATTTTAKVETPPSDSDTCLFAQRDYMGRTCLHYMAERIGRGLWRLQHRRRQDRFLERLVGPPQQTATTTGSPANGFVNQAAGTGAHSHADNNDEGEDDEMAVRALAERCQLLVSAHPVAVTVADNDGLIPLTLLLSLRPDDDADEEESEDTDDDGDDGRSSMDSSPPKRKSVTTSSCPMDTIFLQLVHLLSIEAPSLLTDPDDILQAQKMFVGQTGRAGGVSSSNNNNNTNATKRLCGVYMHRPLRRLSISSSSSFPREFVERPLMRVHPNPLSYALLYSKSLPLINLMLEASSCRWWNPLAASSLDTPPTAGHSDVEISSGEDFSETEDLDDDDDEDEDDDEMETEFASRSSLRSSAILMRQFSPALAEGRNEDGIAAKGATIAAATTAPHGCTNDPPKREKRALPLEQGVVNGCTVVVTNDREVPLHIAVTRRAPLRVLERLVSDKTSGWSGAAALVDRCGLTPIDWLWIRHVVDRTTSTDPNDRRLSWSNPPNHTQGRKLPTIKASKRRYLPVTYEARWRVVLAEVEDGLRRAVKRTATFDGHDTKQPGTTSHGGDLPLELKDVWQKAAMLLPRAALAITSVLRSCALASRSTTSPFLGPHFQWLIFSADTLRDYPGSKLTMSVVWAEQEKEQAQSRFCPQEQALPSVLHAAALLPFCPRAFVLLAIHHFGDQLQQVDSRGNLPLHYAVGREWWNGWTERGAYIIAAGVRRVTQTIKEPSIVPDLVRAFPEACRIRNSQKRLPLHLAIDSALRGTRDNKNKNADNGDDVNDDDDSQQQQQQQQAPLSDNCHDLNAKESRQRLGTPSLPDGVRHTLLAFPEGLGERDGLTNLFPFMLASVGPGADTNMTYVLLRENPTLVRYGRGIRRQHPVS